MPQTIWLRAALDALEQATLVFDTKLKLRAHNRSAAVLLRLPKSADRKLTLTALLPHLADQPLPTTEVPLTIAHDSVAFDGSSVAVSGHLHRISGSKEQGWLLQLRSAPSPEQALRESPQFLTNLIDALPSPIFFKDRNGIYLGCNRAFEETLKCTRDDLVGKSVYEFSPPDLAETYHRMDESLFNAGLGATQIYETSIEQKDGERREARFHKATFEDMKGELGGLIGILIDVTEEKRANRKARSAHQRLKDAMEAIHDGFCLFDAEDRLVLVNRRVFDLYPGFGSRDRAIGMDAAELLSIVALRHRDPDASRDWVGRALAHHRNAAGDSLLLPMRDERWIEIRNYSTHEGGVVSLHTDITSIKRSIDQAEHRALHDPLTGLANRVLFEERLVEAQRQADRDQSAVVLLYIDLDDFKEINDQHGHQFGDECLRRVADRLSTGIRESDTLARVGGDEFAAIYSVDRDRSCVEAEHLCNRLLAALARPLQLAEKRIRIEVAVGAACYPWCGDDIDTLMRRADDAVHQAKRQPDRPFRLCAHCRKQSESPGFTDALQTDDNG